MSYLQTEVRDAGKKGKGLFSKAQFLIGEMVMVCGPLSEYALEHVNHSCDPNCRLDGPNQIWLMVARPIEPGDEITIDYRTLGPIWQAVEGFKCKCGSVNCREEFIK